MAKKAAQNAQNGATGVNTHEARQIAPNRRNRIINNLFRNERVTCNRPGLHGKALTLIEEIQMGKHAWAWKAEYPQTWTDRHGLVHITRGIAIVREWDIEVVADMEAA